ncbi:hypothetical protein ACIOMP_08910 [Pseudomonas protegens]|uniref:hypothetical protein n=1 Tax=Pseudomonas protegens TaxID=380021 RepID=UPI0038216D6C
MAPNNAEAYVRSKARERKKQAREMIFAGLVAILSAITAALSFSGFLDTKNKATDVVEVVVSSFGKQYASADSLNGLKAQLDALNSEIKSLQQVKFPSQPEVDLAPIEARLSALSKRLSDLETAITSDPVKALTLPLMKRDYENLSKAVLQDKVSMREDLNRIWQFIFLCLGGLGSIGVGLSVWWVKSVSKQSDKPA